MFPEGGISGWGSGYETHMTQYTWMTTVYDDVMYLSTMDETSLLHVFAQLVNGELLEMSEEEWKSQVNYIKVLVELIKNSFKQDEKISLMSAENGIEELTEDNAIAIVEDAIENVDDVYSITDEQEKEVVDAIVDGDIDFNKDVINNKDAKAVLVNNPTYYGICSDLKEITKLAHSYGMKVLVDEAHGTHFYFNDNLPTSAMEAGADMAAVSMHKTGGSLTQSSILLINNDVNKGYVHQIINLMQTTSASYLLLSSLDISRRNLAVNGSKMIDKIIDLAEYARKEINEIGGFYAYSKELINKKDFFDFDITKLSVNTLGIGLAGIEVYSILRDEYDIQIEFGDLGNFLAIVSVGDTKFAIERLVSALSDIKRIYSKDKTGMIDHEYIEPEVVMSPKDAFYGNKIVLPINESIGEVSCEFVMCYPPGIPILAPGERITKEILEYISYAKMKGCSLTGTQDEKIEFINVLKE